MEPTYSPDHYTRGLAKLLGQFQDSPKLKALLGSYLKQIQALEDFERDVDAVRSINDGVGVYLDGIGKLVGRGRMGLSDADYKYALRAQIRINRSCGKTEDFIAVLMLSVDNDPTYSVEVRGAGPGCMVVEMHGPVPDSVVNVLWTSVRQVKGAGVRLEFVFSEQSDTYTFACNATTAASSSTRGDLTEKSGLGWTGDLLTGGQIAGVYASSA